MENVSGERLVDNLEIVSGLRTENDSGEQLHQWTIDGEQQLWASNGER